MCMDKKKQVVRLRVCFFALYALAGAVALAFELTDGAGGWFLGADSRGAMTAGEYLARVLGIGGTLVLVPLALKLMSFRAVSLSVASGSGTSDRNYVRWSLLRLVLLFMSIFPNLLFYYIWWDSSFGCCALIGILASLFCWPSLERWEQEAGASPEEEESKNECRS